MEQNGFAQYKRSCVLYIVEAAVEYFIHLCVTATFLTAILNEIGVSAALQGINLRIDDGEFVFLVGTSTSGKSVYSS